MADRDDKNGFGEWLFDDVVKDADKNPQVISKPVSTTDLPTRTIRFSPDGDRKRKANLEEEDGGKKPPAVQVRR